MFHFAQGHHDIEIHVIVRSLGSIQEWAGVGVAFSGRQADARHAIIVGEIFVDFFDHTNLIFGKDSAPAPKGRAGVAAFGKDSAPAPKGRAGVAAFGKDSAPAPKGREGVAAFVKDVTFSFGRHNFGNQKKKNQKKKG